MRVCRETKNSKTVSVATRIEYRAMKNSFTVSMIRGLMQRSVKLESVETIVASTFRIFSLGNLKRLKKELVTKVPDAPRLHPVETNETFRALISGLPPCILFDDRETGRASLEK